MLPLPPPGAAAHVAVDPARPPAARRAADPPPSPDRVHLTIVATDRAAVRVSPRGSHVRVTLSAPRGGSRVNGPAAGGPDSLEGSSCTGGPGGAVAGDGQEGLIRVGLAVVEQVTVHVAAAPALAVKLRVAPVDTVGQVGTAAAPHATQERVRVQLTVWRPACSSQVAEDEVQGLCVGGLCGGLGARSGAGGTDGAEGAGGQLQHACSLDTAVNEVLEEVLENVAREVCPSSWDTGAVEGGVGVLAGGPEGRGSPVGVARAAALRIGAPGPGAAPRGGAPAAAERVCVQLFVEQAQGFPGEGPSEVRCLGGTALTSRGAPGSGSVADGGVGVAEGSSGVGGESFAGVDELCVRGGAGAVSMHGTGGNGGGQDGAADGAVEDGGVLEAWASVTSVAVDEVVRELLAHALAEGCGSTEGGVGAD